jgi:hypothetical protein
MTTRLLIAATAVAALTFAASAQADTLLFSYFEPGGVSFSFEQSMTPVVIAYADGINTETQITNWTGSVGPYTAMVWYSVGEGGMFDTPDQANAAVGPQIYGGSESNPTFTTGVFKGTDDGDGLDGTLTVTLVPEPAAWALMLVGFGALGLGLRASRKTPATA